MLLQEQVLNVLKCQGFKHCCLDTCAHGRFGGKKSVNLLQGGEILDHDWI